MKKQLVRYRALGYTKVAPALLLMFVSAISDYWSDNDYFSRSGSVLVLVAVLLEFDALEYKRVDDNLDSKFMRNFTMLAHQTALRTDANRDRSELDSTIEALRSELTNEKSELAGRMQDEFKERYNQLSRDAFILAIGGTAIWGYGDLIKPTIALVARSL